MLSLYKLEIFATVTEAGSFSKAADRLYLTQSAISQHIQDLESQLGTQLFIRGRRGVTLTPAGQILLDYTTRILQLVREAASAVTDVELLASGQLRLGATPGTDVYLLPDWIGGFQQRFPNLTASLTTDVTSQIVSQVLNHTLDLGIVEGEPADDERLDRMMLREVDQMVIVGRGHPWFKRKMIPLEALNAQPFIARPPNSHTRAWMESLLQKHNVTLDIVAEFGNPEAIKRAVGAGLGITILPEYVVQHECRLDIMHALPIQNATLQRTIRLIWDKRAPFNPITRAFVSFLTGSFPQLHMVLEEESR